MYKARIPFVAQWARVPRIHQQ